MARVRQISLSLILLSLGVSLFWGIPMGLKAIPGGAVDLQVVYYATRCLIQHHDPYNLLELRETYQAESLKNPPQPTQRIELVPGLIYAPTIFPVIGLLAFLPWKLAYLLWMVLLGAGFLLAAILVLYVGTEYTAGVALALTSFLLANSALAFALGNSALLVVSLCIIGAWCLLKERFVLGGVVCLTIALAVKPHDSGLVWLYFLLAGGVYRKRALYILGMTVLLSLASIIWVSQFSPHWVQEWSVNQAQLTTHGSISDPGPDGVANKGAGIIIDLQAAVSIFRDDPHIYNPISYFICGAILLVWSFITLRSSYSPGNAWLALAAIAPLTMLVTYHRPYDAKLLLLTIPACTVLWSQGGIAARIALLLTTAGIVFTGDIPLQILSILTDDLHMNASGLLGKILTVVLIRPVPLILFSISMFYLCVYVRRAPTKTHVPLVRQFDAERVVKKAAT
jgi:hypothetical protein